MGKTSAAFSGTIDNYDLYISLDIIKKRGKDYLCAYMNDHFEWYEWDYESQNEFEDKIVEYFCENINRTIKTVTETKRHKYVRITEYYLDKETNEWGYIGGISSEKISFNNCYFEAFNNIAVNNKPMSGCTLLKNMTLANIGDAEFNKNWTTDANGNVIVKMHDKEA